MLADNEELIEEIREKCSVFTTDLRIKIVLLLYEHKSLYVQEMMDLLKVERQLIAHNLLKLKHHRIVKSKADGTWRSYSLVNPQLVELLIKIV